MIMLVVVSHDSTITHYLFCSIIVRLHAEDADRDEGFSDAQMSRQRTIERGRTDHNTQDVMGKYRYD